MRQRTITAFFFGSAMLGGVFGGKTTFFALFLLIVAGCAWEFLGLAVAKGEKGRRSIRSFGTLLTAAPFAIYAQHLLFSEAAPGPDFMAQQLQVANAQVLTCALYGMMALLLYELFMKSAYPFQRMGQVALSIAYLGLPFALLIPCSLRPDTLDYAAVRVFGLLWLVWANDSIAYLVGSRVGKTKLFERISPKKTWEGTVGGAIGAQLMALLLSAYFTDFSRTEWLVLAAVATVFGTLGDLVESMLKRSLGVKDSGTLLPGHGGMLDRFDAFFFALPFYWLAICCV
jgi:phosphatidate cytidylyltransferase